MARQQQDKTKALPYRFVLNSKAVNWNKQNDSKLPGRKDYFQIFRMQPRFQGIF